MSVFAQTGYDARLEWGPEGVAPLRSPKAATLSREAADTGAHVLTGCLRSSGAGAVAPRLVEGTYRNA